MTDRGDPAFVALESAGREALRMESQLDLVHQWLAEVHLADRIIDSRWPLTLEYRPIKIQRSDDSQSVVLDHELALVVDFDADDADLLEATDDDREKADLGSVVYAQRWKTKRRRLSADDTQLLFFALTVGRRHVAERARDLLLVLSSHFGRPPLAIAPSPPPHVALETLLAALRPFVEAAGTADTSEQD